MKSKRKILILIPSLRGGGAERTLINLLDKIDYARYDIDLVVVSKHGPYLDQIPEQVNVIYFYRLHIITRFLSFLHRKTGFDWFFRRKMKKLRKQYDVGISFLDSTFTDFLFFTDIFDKRVALVHSSYLSHEDYISSFQNPEYRKKVIAHRYSCLDAIYFVSHDSQNDFIELFGDFPNVGVVYNLIDAESVIRKSLEPPGFKSESGFIFSAIGSLLPVKGFDRLIRAAKIAFDQGYQFELHIAGDGPEKKSLEKLIRQSGLKDIVTLHGFLDNPYPLLKLSDVFVMSSVSEALPTVLCEAMILEKPSLVTNCSGCRGLVESGEYGLMAEQDDNDLAQKMMLYMDSPELLSYYSKKSAERSKLFNDSEILKSYYKIFDWEQITDE